MRRPAKLTLVVTPLLMLFTALAVPSAIHAAESIATEQPTLLPPDYLERCNIVWTSPSDDSAGSMPVGGGDIGVNVWVEDGDVLLYAQQFGAFDKNGEYLKMGRFRLRFTPNPLAAAQAVFTQELKVREGAIVIRGDSPETGPVQLTVWVEPDRPVIHLETTAANPAALDVAYESWRFHDVDLLPEERPAAGRRSSIFDFDGYQVPVVKRGDTIEPRADGVTWYHDVGDDFNAFDLALQVEELTAAKSRMWDPLVRRISGGTLRGASLVAAGTADGTYQDTPYRAWRFRSRAPARTHHVEIVGLVAQPSTPVEWKARLQRIVNPPSDLGALRVKHAAWWEAFWARSYIAINPTRDESDNGWRVGRNHQLFRAQLGANSRGLTKFNGGNLTFDARLVKPDYHFGPDYRRWGGWSYTAANQILVYSGYLRNGDFDAMIPQFDIYRHGLANAVARTRAHWGHGGASFAEQFQHSGMPVASHYGFIEHGFSFFQRPRDFEKGEMANPWISTLYAGQLNFADLILDYARYTGRDISDYKPFLLACMEFYDAHYQQIHRRNTGRPLDEHGQLVIFPSTPGEHHLNSTNPADAIAGLNAIVDGLLALRTDLLTDAERTFVESFGRRLPPLPLYQAEMDGRTRTLVGASALDGGDGSSRAPGLFALYPFQRAFPGSPLFGPMGDTWDFVVSAARKEAYIGWQRSVIYSARLGRNEEARSVLARKLEDAARLPRGNMSIPNRFPTFRGPGYDWTPDHNWGGGGMIGLQDMLLQTPGEALLLLPAWPRDWDVTFKLHAPRNTTVEASFTAGKLRTLRVTPREREKDIIYHGERSD